MPSINQAGRETEHMVLPDDAEFVSMHEAHEHGYWGVSPDTTPREEFTFAGAAKRLAQRTSSDQSPRSEGEGSSSGASRSRHSAGNRSAKGSEE